MNKVTILKFYSSYKLFIFPTVVALSCLILIVLVILPQTIKLITNQRVGSDLLVRSQNLEVKAQTLESLNSDDLSQNLGYALAIYPSFKDFGNVVGLIQETTSKVGFSIISLSLAGTGSKTDAQSFNVSLQLSGSKALLPSLLANFENGPRLMRVGNLEVSSQSGGGIQVSLGLDVLYSPAPADFGTVDSPLPTLSEKNQDLLVRLAKLSAPSVSRGGVPFVSAPRGKTNPFE